ncbi:MAG: substrate-binding domain-containing protein [Clostridiales bacterium]|nr:substrate-binding domain-containing protein [Clostridiales bacterium]
MIFCGGCGKRFDAVYVAPAPAAETPVNTKKKKKRKKGLIVGVVIFLILALASGILIWLYNDGALDDTLEDWGWKEKARRTERRSSRDDDDDDDRDRDRDDDDDRDRDDDDRGRDDDDDDDDKEDLIRVGIINNDPNESGYRTANDADNKKVFCEENGYDSAFFYSLKNDEQIAAAEKFIRDGADYLLISPAGTEGWESVLESAKEAGIKVIFFDRMADVDESLYETFVTDDMEAAAQSGVAWLASQGLREYNIIHLQGVLGSLAQTSRTGPLDEKVASNDNWNYVMQYSAEWNAENAEAAVQSVIDSGVPFNVIYAENDDMARGAARALDNAGISHGAGGDVIIMSFDGNKWALEELLAGRWNYIMPCNPRQAAYIDNVIKNGPVSGKVTIVDAVGFDTDTITQEYVDSYGF